MDDKYITCQNQGRRIALGMLFGLFGLVFGPIGGGLGVGFALILCSWLEEKERKEEFELARCKVICTYHNYPTDTMGTDTAFTRDVSAAAFPEASREDMAA
jgi:hypothetical protein